MFGPSDEEKLAEIRAAYNNAQQTIATSMGTKRADYTNKDIMLQHLAKAYTNEKREAAVNFFCEVLKSLDDPKYIRLAEAIKVVEELTFKNEKYAGESYLVANFDNDVEPNTKTIRTTYREFQEIRSHNSKISSKIIKKLGSVYEFVNDSMMSVISQVEKLCKDSAVRVDISKLDKVLEYLDNEPSVQAALSGKMPKNMSKLYSL